MAFVNEKVPEQDIDKYGMREINMKFWKADYGYVWTIDRKRNIYLRWMTYDREDVGRNDFTFYWKGVLLTIRLYSSGGGVPGGKGSTTWKFGGWQLPENLAPRREEIVADLKEALIAFKDFGINSSIADHTAYFDF